MKKWIALILSILLAGLPAMAAENPADEEDPIKELLSDAKYRAEVALDAIELIRMAGMNAVWAENGFFAGVPDNDTAWALLSLYANQHVSGSDTLFTDADLSAMYADIFAQGSFHDYAATPVAQFSAVQGGYQFFPADGESVCGLSINNTDAYTDTAVVVDLSVWTTVQGENPTAFSHNAIVRLQPDPLSSYGARIEAYIKNEEIPSFPSAEASSSLSSEGQAGNSYGPENAVDGKLETCWSCRSSEDEERSITLLADEPQKLRGVQFTPGYAKSKASFLNNMRAKTVRVTLSDGWYNDYSFEDQDGEYYQETVVLPLGSLMESSSVKLQVLDTYSGKKYKDICISEILVF